MPKRQPSLSKPSALPKIWLISDARNDAALERVLARLPGGSGFIFRHYHLPPPERRARYLALARLARRHRHLVALAGTARQARRWGADAAYGSAQALSRGPALLRLVTVHSLREIGQARRAGGVLLSPVFTTRSHPGGAVLGPIRFHLLAGRATCPVIALGGMDRSRAARLHIGRWAAIDGICRREGHFAPR